MNNENNIFEIASRGRFRFQFKGSISVEDLWCLSLKDLDSIYKMLNSELKQTNEQSLLETKTQGNEELDIKIQIIKHIFDTKLNEQKSSMYEKQRKEEKQKLLELLDTKKNENLKNKSIEEIQKMIDDLDN